MEARARTPTLLLLGCALVLLVARVPSLSEPLGMDQAMHALGARELLAGGAFYRDFFDHKPPAVYVCFVPLWLLAGAEGWGCALADLLLVALQLCLVHALASRAFGRRAAAGAAVAFTFLAAAPAWGGKIGYCQPIVFVNVLALAAAAGAAGPARPATWFLLGVAASAMFALKLLPALLVGPALLLAGAGRLPRPRALGLVAAGGAAGLLPWAAWFAATGTTGDLIDAVLGFNALYAGLAVNPLLESLLQKAWVLLPAAVLAAAGFARGPGAPPREPLPGARAALALWLALAVGILLAERKYYYYHFIVLLPPLALAAGLGLERLLERAMGGAPGRRLLWSLALGAAGVALLAALATEWARRNENFLANRLLASRPIAYAETAEVTYGASLLSTAVTAAAVRGHSAPGDELMVWGMNPLLYLLADRRPFTPYVLHHFVLVDEEPWSRWGDGAERRRRFLDRLRAQPPKCFVVLAGDRSIFERVDSVAQVSPELAALLRERFELRWRVRNAFLWVLR